MHEQTVDRTRSALKLAYGLAGIVSGADKFTNILTDWSMYLSPLSRRLIPVKPSTFMRAVGLVEIGAGALVLSRHTRLGAYVFGGWLGAIALQLFTHRRFHDVAVRDLMMALGAVTLAKLTEATMEERKQQEREIPLEEIPYPGSVYAPA
jgi:hypothetical protein